MFSLAQRIGHTDPHKMARDMELRTALKWAEFLTNGAKPKMTAEQFLQAMGGKGV